MSGRPLSSDRAKKAIKKLQKEKMSLEEIQAELVQKGISAETTTKLIKEIHGEKIWDGLTVGAGALVLGLMLAGFSLGVWQGWIEFSFLSNRRVIILIMGGIVGVIMIGIGVLALIETFIEASKRDK